MYNEKILSSIVISITIILTPEYLIERQPSCVNEESFGCAWREINCDKETKGWLQAYDEWLFGLQV